MVMDMGGQAKKGVILGSNGIDVVDCGEICWDYRECTFYWIVRTIKTW